VKRLVAVLALAATFFGVAGAAALLIERRLAALAPGGVEFVSLHYNPFTGRLAVANVRARDAAGREVFRADSVVATANPFSIITGAISLGRVRVAAPHLTLRPDAGFDMDDVAAGLGAAHAFFGSRTALALPLAVDDLVIGDGVVSIEGAGRDGAPLVLRDLDVRLGRLTTASLGERDVAFAVEMAVYGTLVHVTVRARGLDAAALLRDFPMSALEGVERGAAEIDADLVLSAGRVLVSGFVRLADAVLILPLPGRPRLQAASVAVSADAFDLAAGTGRITRLDLGAPTLALPAAGAAAVWKELVAPLHGDGELIVRRISITDGTLVLDGANGVRLTRVQLAAHIPERRADSGWVVSGRATLGADAEVSVDGLVARDLRALDAVTRLQRVPLAPWRAFAGAAPGWDARVSFDGRLRVVAREGEILATAAGQAELSDVNAPAGGGFRAERIALGIRQLRWPTAEAVFDRVVVTRPAFGLAALTAWPNSLVTGGMRVVDGELRADIPGRALHDVAVELAPDDTGGLTRLRLSASTEGGRRVDLDRVMPYATAPTAGLSLGFLAAALDEAARGSSPEAPAAFPAGALR
jgi:hypothetical protein